MGNKTLRKAGTPSNKGKQEGAHWETKGEKTLGKADTPSNKGKQEGRRAGRQAGRQGLEKADTPSNKGKQNKEDKLGDKMRD